MEIKLTTQQLKLLLFPDLTTELDDARKFQVRHILDYTDCVAIPSWLAIAINELQTEVFHVQVIEEYRYLWPAETWRKSRDRRSAVLDAARRAIAADAAAANHAIAKTRYQEACYRFVMDLANRIVDNWYPHMKKGFLKQSFERMLVNNQWNLQRFRESLSECFQDEVINTCWINEPEPEQEHDRSGNHEGVRSVYQVGKEECCVNTQDQQTAGANPEAGSSTEQEDTCVGDADSQAAGAESPTDDETQHAHLQDDTGATPEVQR